MIAVLAKRNDVEQATTPGHSELWFFYIVMLCGLRTEVLEAVPHSSGEDRIEIHVAEVVDVPRREGREALHEAWVVLGLPASVLDGDSGVAGAAGKGYFDGRLRDVDEAELHGEAEVFARARNDIAVANRQSRRDLAEVY
jgi:hypothetical protein